MNEIQKIEIGSKIANALHLIELQGKYLTAYGKKSNQGITELILDIINDVTKDNKNER